MSSTPAQTPPAGFAAAFAPLRQTTFFVLWAATVLGDVGGFMRDVASAWLVTDLSASPAAVALIQAAATLPIFILAIPAGVLADILDRRRLLIVVQLALAGVSLGLLVLAHTGAVTVERLILMTLLSGAGAALIGPAWQAIVPELVPRGDLRNAVALNSLGINVARSIGPAAGGAILAGFGAAAVYGVDVLSDLLAVAALLWWKRPKSDRHEMPEQFFGAFRAGVRYARSSRELHVVLLRAVVFFLFSSAVWALLPLLARRVLGGDAAFYGVLLGSVGVGAIAGALSLPALRRRLDSDRLMLLASLVAAAVMPLLVAVPSRPVAIALMLAMGAAWIVALTTLNGTAQSILPNWVRARGLAIYLTAFNGAMTLGSIAWGGVASALGIPAALWLGGIGLALAGLALHRTKLPAGDQDLQASRHWPEPLLSEPSADDRGPVMVQVTYRIAAEDMEAFSAAMSRLSSSRRRDGAYAWGVAEDTADPGRIIEWFLVESWAEHMRQHLRVTQTDADVQAAVASFHQGGTPPLVNHYIALGEKPGN